MAKDSLSTRLRHRVTLYEKKESENALGETDYQYQPVRTVWAEILPTNGRMKDVPGDMEYSEITHKITLRVDATEGLTNDMYFMHGQTKLDIRYIMPQYKTRDCVEVFARQEDGQ